MTTGIILVGAVLLGTFQSHVSHALHRLRTVPSSIADGYVVDNAFDDQRSHLLCPLPRSRHQSHSELGLFKTTVSRKGKKEHPSFVLIL